MSMPIGTPCGAHPLTDLGANIKWHMVRRRLKHDALAQIAGVGKNTLSSMCYSGRPSPSLATVQKVADALGVPLWSMLLPPEDRDEP